VIAEMVTLPDCAAVVSAASAAGESRDGSKLVWFGTQRQCKGGMTMADAVKTVEQLCAENGIDARQLAERSGLDEQRVVAIVLGRWTPSPQERDGIAAAFGLTRDQIAWGHKTPVQHLYGQGPA